MSAFQQGYDAYNNFVSLSSNPHKPGTVKHSDWLRGWYAAKAEWFI